MVARESSAVSIGATLTTGTDTSLPLDQPIIIELTINQVQRGEFPIIFRKDGDILLRGVDLEAIAVTPPYGPPQTFEGDKYFSLRQLGVTGVRFDEGLLALYANLPPKRLPKQAIDFRREETPGVIRPDYNSGYFNYRILNSGDDSSAVDTWLLAGELGVRYSDMFFRHDAAHLRYSDERQTIRYGTSITYDNRETLQRLIVGDFAASSGSLGSTLAYGGLSFSKTYAINPYFIHQPTAGFIGTLNAPSEVELYLDGMPLRSENLAPGEFELNNVNYYGGRHDLELVIRDSFGREQYVAYPFYFSNQNLRKGLHDYSYNIGWIRTGMGTSNDEYGDWASSAYHRYGLSDSLTMGMRGEVENGLYNLGPTAVLRLNHWGILSGAISGSRTKDDTGWAGSVSYVYQQRDFYVQGALRSFTQAYAVVGRQKTDDRPEKEAVVSTGVAVKGLGNLGISLRQLKQYLGTNQNLASFSYSHTFNRKLNVIAALTRVEANDEYSTNFFLGLSYHPGHSLTAGVHHQQDKDGYSDIFQFGNTTPVGEGLGYRLTADRSMNSFGERIRFSPSMQYNSRYGIVTAAMLSEKHEFEELRTDYQWSVSGGIGYVADSINVSRPITDSFAVVDVGDLEGVRVYQSSQEMGRTDKNGRLFLPNMGSYQINRIAIDDRDIPIDYSLDKTEVRSSPPLRSGSLISFGVQRYQAVTGRLQVNLGKQWVPVEFSKLRINVGGTTMSVPTGRGGEFYLENLSPSRYRAKFDYQGVHCDFELAIPESDEMVIELGELNVCEASH